MIDDRLMSADRSMVSYINSKRLHISVLLPHILPAGIIPASFFSHREDSNLSLPYRRVASNWGLPCHPALHAAEGRRRDCNAAEPVGIQVKLLMKITKLVY